MSSGWGCPHENKGQCMRVRGRDCEPGMKGCTLSGKVQFANETKNTPRITRWVKRKSLRDSAETA